MTMMTKMAKAIDSDPHGGGPTVRAGRPLAEASAAVVLIHGRGATAESILSLSGELDLPEAAFLAPQASGFRWYPQSFLAPREANQPDLDSALARIDSLVEEILASGPSSGGLGSGGLGSGGLGSERIVLAGFSQGACLAAEYAYRHPRRYGAVLAFTGGLIGPPGTAWPEAKREVPGDSGEVPGESGEVPGDSLRGTPVLLTSGDPDPHVPRARVEETAEVLRGLGARVDLRIYPGRPHTITADEMEHARAVLAPLR